MPRLPLRIYSDLVIDFLGKKVIKCSNLRISHVFCTTFIIMYVNINLKTPVTVVLDGLETQSWTSYSKLHVYPCMNYHKISTFGAIIANNLFTLNFGLPWNIFWKYQIKSNQNDQLSNYYSKYFTHIFYNVWPSSTNDYYCQINDSLFNQINNGFV